MRFDRRNGLGNDNALAAHGRDVITGGDCLLSQTIDSSDIDDIIAPLELESFDFQEEFRNVEDNLIEASENASFSSITDPTLTQTAVVAKSEESSKNEWGPLIGEYSNNLGIDAQVKSFGETRYQIRTIEGLCQKSLNSSEWHVKAGSGILDITLNFYGIPNEVMGSREFSVRVVLFRQNAEFQHFPVDRICPKHLTGETKNPQHVLQPLREFSQEFFFSESDCRHSVSFPCLPANDGSGVLSKQMKLQFKCLASCHTCSNDSFRNKERAQDLLLVFNLEVRTLYGTITLGRTSVPVWPKTIISRRDLLKESRRLVKGGQAQKKRRLINMRQNASAADNFAKDIIKLAKKKNISTEDLIESLKKQIN